MTYYADLTPFEYEDLPSEWALQELRKDPDPWMLNHLERLELERKAVNVGWLSPDHPFPRGETLEAFEVALFRLCQAQDPMEQHLGFHPCVLDDCPGGLEQPTEALEGEGSCYLGSGVLVIRGTARNYAAPDLIFHYVKRHHYKPPDEFIEAVLSEAEGMGPVDRRQVVLDAIRRLQEGK